MSIMSSQNERIFITILRAFPTLAMSGWNLLRWKGQSKRTPSDAEVQIDTSHWRRAYWDTVIGFWVRDVANLC